MFCVYALKCIKRRNGRTMKLYVFQCKKITNFTLSMKNKQENAVKDFFFFFFHFFRIFRDGLPKCGRAITKSF